MNRRSKVTRLTDESFVKRVVSLYLKDTIFSDELTDFWLAKQCQEVGNHRAHSQFSRDGTLSNLRSEKEG